MATMTQQHQTDMLMPYNDEYSQEFLTVQSDADEEAINETNFETIPSTQHGNHNSITKKAKARARTTQHTPAQRLPPETQTQATQTVEEIERTQHASRRNHAHYASNRPLNIKSTETDKITHVVPYSAHISGTLTSTEWQVLYTSGTSHSTTPVPKQYKKCKTANGARATQGIDYSKRATALS
eukprot:IDg9525t1